MIEQESKVSISVDRTLMRFTMPSPAGRAHPVTDPDRPLGQQDETRDEVVDDRLQAEADADAQRTRNEREVREIEPRRRQGKDRGQDVAGIGCSLARSNPERPC